MQGTHWEAHLLGVSPRVVLRELPQRKLLALAAGVAAILGTPRAARGVGQALQAAWLEEDVMQCGYCQAGQLMNATALLTANPNPSQDEIENAMRGNICRCACYKRINQAIARVAQEGPVNA